MRIHKGGSKYPGLGILKLLRGSFLDDGRGLSRKKLFEEAQRSKIKETAFSKVVYDLKRGGFIEYVGNGHIILTDKGVDRVNFDRLENLGLPKKKDGLWRVVIFDIPEKKKYIRKILRDKLIEFNFYQLQKSVYVTPFICEQEINEIAELLEVPENISIIKAKDLGSEERKIQRFFRQ